MKLSDFCINLDKLRIDQNGEKEPLEDKQKDNWDFLEVVLEDIEEDGEGWAMMWDMVLVLEDIVGIECLRK